MKFSGKIVKLFTGGTVGFTVALSPFLAGMQLQTANAATQITQALSPEEVNLRAKQITVRIDGASVGSGSLINYSDGVYTVLTNWHVIKNSGDYIVQTIDGRQYQVDPTSIKQLPGLDLAILQFISNQNYQLAEMGDSVNLNEGQNIYFAGYPGELRTEDNRYYRFFTANLVGILPKPTENGYSLVYNGEAFPGMSGGPVFNKEGLMIGVHGEANVNAISGGTSNYAIPINSYQQAIASATSQGEIAQLDNQLSAENPPATTTADEINTPETSPPSTNDVPNQPEVETTSPESDNSNQPEESLNPNNISSVPTFTADPPEKTATGEVEDEPEVIVEPTTGEIEDEPEVAPKPETDTTTTTDDPEVAAEIVEPSTTPKQIALVSEKTGIDYTTLRDLLKEQKWSEADLHTYKLVEQIVKTAKQQNKHMFIELKTIAEFSCPDIRTIDYLWQEYSGNKFGFSSQQEVWQNVNQKGDFSTQTWRRFATEVGWKKGEVASGSGYLLYEELNFNPTEAPIGHLPWWFALPDEEQNVIKHLFARCNFDPSVQELEAEARTDNPKNPSSENDSDFQDEASNNSEPNIEKSPKPSG